MITTSPSNTPDTPPSKAYLALSTSAVGLEMGLAVLLCWSLGTWLDNRYATEPYLTFTFLGLGIAAGFNGIFRVARQTKRILQESNETTDHDH